MDWESAAVAVFCLAASVGLALASRMLWRGQTWLLGHDPGWYVRVCKVMLPVAALAFLAGAVDAIRDLVV